MALFNLKYICSCSYGGSMLVARDLLRHWTDCDGPDLDKWVCCGSPCQGRWSRVPLPPARRPFLALAPAKVREHMPAVLAALGIGQGERTKNSDGSRRGDMEELDERLRGMRDVECTRCKTKSSPLDILGYMVSS